MSIIPIKHGSTESTGEIIKSNTLAGVTAQDYASQGGWISGRLNSDGKYSITKSRDGAGPLIYNPTNDAEFILFCNSTASPPPSSTITTIDEALIFISNSDYMLFYGDTPVDNFPSNLPMDGLSCYLDSQINSSTSTSGKWLDVSGNGLDFLSYGTALPLTTVGGYPAFQFNGSGYFQCNDKYGSVNMGGDCTLVMWVYCVDIAERDTIFEKVGVGGTSYQCEIAMTWETGEQFSYYSRKTPYYDYASTASMTKNAWNMISIKMSTGLTSTARTGFWSKNGSGYSASYTSRSNTALTPAAQIRVGNGYAGSVEGNNGIGAVLTYNKMLSNTEIQNLYIATKGRYGL